MNQIFFIDARVSNAEALIADLPSNSLWFRIAADADGILQLQNTVAAYGGLASIHIISHANVGRLYLGNAVLDSTNLAYYSDALRSIGASLADTGDILLYGCNLAEGSVGASFIEKLATLTGADVAASQGITGQGGDWLLEASTGLIEVSAIVVKANVDALAAYLGTGGNDVLFGSDADDVISGLGGADTLSGGAGTTPSISIDTLAPTVTTFSPDDNATTVLVDANLTLTFSEAVKFGTGNLVLTNTANAADTRTISAADASQVSFAGSTVTVNPTSDLLWGTHTMH